jgi:nicotinamide-nucleotide amidase
MRSIDEAFDCAARLGRALQARGSMVTTVESCTGGMVAMALTETPGSSAWFDRGLVTYTNDAKHDLVGVPASDLAKHGAVSQEVALAMALGALRRAPLALLALSVTGIAGPAGATRTKPVGTVVHGFALRVEIGDPGAAPAAELLVDENSGETFRHQVMARHYPGDRRQIRLAATIFALSQGLLLVNELQSRR